MSESDKTSLGDRIKLYEQPSTSRKAFKGQPLVVRLDGSKFHTWTRGLQRPYDERLSIIMRRVMVALIERYQPLVGYTQSDELILIWYHAPHETPEYPFDGRFQKIESLTASYATAVFNSQIAELLPEKRGCLAMFDSRAFVVPDLKEAYHVMLWRHQDATKNAISMAAQSMFSHGSLQGLHGNEMQEKMWKEKGVDFNDYPAFFKRGTFAKWVKETRAMSDEDRARIPQKHWPIDGTITRTSIMEFDCWLGREPDPIGILFGDAILQHPELYRVPSCQPT